MFSLASKLLSTIASPAFEKSYERVCSIWDARDELHKLRRSIQTIQAVLLDAEKREDAAVKDWVQRVKDVLYDADDLFDEVATDDLLEEQIKGNKHLKKVRVFCSKLNPVVTRDSIAKKVKAIRKSLNEISTDMDQFKFVRCAYETPVHGRRTGQDPGSFVDSKDVFGRKEDKKVILEVLLNESNKDHQDVSVIAVVGIGGMGKTTLAQLVYNDKEVEKKFEKRWFACISDTSVEKEIIGKIFQSISGPGVKYHDFTVSQLQAKIRESVSGSNNFLLVLDDVWDEDHARWQGRMRLLCGGAKGSKIVVTTRSLSVAKAVDASITHTLAGLSDDESWDLFKRVAFTPEQGNDSRWTDLGREIVNKCANVPLAIKSIGSLLYTKATIQEWKSFRNVELAKLGESGHDPVMSVLKLSYDHLHSNLKQCFAYCSLYPKDSYIYKHDLMYLWIAQGYIKANHEQQTIEEVAHSYFMELLRRSFFMEARQDDIGDIVHCKMHDLIHDLAQLVAGEENTCLTMSSNQFSGNTRHVSVHNVSMTENLWQPLLNAKRLRSLHFVNKYSDCRLAVGQKSTSFKFLRALRVQAVEMENVPSCIGELRHLRCLDLSHNPFKVLPDSITKLLNLLTLDIQGCDNLQALPNDFRKLINLRHLLIHDCEELGHMPLGFGELTCLQHLSNFKVGKEIGGVRGSRLDVLDGLKLRERLIIDFDVDIDDWDEDESWQLPGTLQELWINNYPGLRIPHWAQGRVNDSSLLAANFVYINLDGGSRVKHLPPFRRLPYLKVLRVIGYKDLEYMEENEAGSSSLVVPDSNALCFPCLKELRLWELPKLEGWSRKVATPPQLLLCPLLSLVVINDCPELKSMPLFSPQLVSLYLYRLNAEAIQPLLTGSGSTPSTSSTSSSSLQVLSIGNCHGLIIFPGEALASLQDLVIWSCDNLKVVPLGPPRFDALEKLRIQYCPGLEEVPNSLIHVVRKTPFTEMLPDFLVHQHALGKLEIVLYERRSL